MEKKRELRVDLMEKQWNQLEIIKEEYGFFSYAEMIRLLIKEKFDSLVKEGKIKPVDLSLKGG